jgi:hypothetical protein
MKFLMLFFLCNPVWACYSMKKAPVSQGLKEQILCRIINEGVYDVSFGQRLTLKVQGLKAQLKLVNTEFELLELVDVMLSGDYRDLHGKGKVSDTVFNAADFRYADLRGFTFSEVKFEASRLQGINLKGVDLSRVEFIDCDLSGAIFDLRTKLPFSVEEALEKGMVIK